jgi:hypothetical protein
MNRSFVTASCGAVLVLVLSACGAGTPNSLPATASRQTQHSHVRLLPPGPCQPDSYGYCYTVSGPTYAKTSCTVNGETSWPSRTIYTYYVSYEGDPPVTFTKTIWPTCGNALSYTSWDPDEPAVEYSDPYLP